MQGHSNSEADDGVKVFMAGMTLWTRETAQSVHTCTQRRWSGGGPCTAAGLVANFAQRLQGQGDALPALP